MKYIQDGFNSAYPYEIETWSIKNKKVPEWLSDRCRVKNYDLDGNIVLDIRRTYSGGLEFIRNDANSSLIITKGTDDYICFDNIRKNLFSLTPSQLELLYKNGVNRLSIGIESFNIDKLGFMERKCDFDDIKSKLDMIRSKGINNINLDLIYGVPEETLKVLKKDIKLLLRLKPTHISTYSLMIEKHTKLYNEGILNISEEEDAKMYELICKLLKRKKFNHYEVSNFSLEGYESKHNLSYWNNEEYYGFGLGASGYMDSFRYDNTSNLSKYLREEWHDSESLLSLQDKMNDEVMLGLRKIKGININSFKDKFGVDIFDTFDLKELIINKELIVKNGYLFVNPKYIYTMNEILIKII